MNTQARSGRSAQPLYEIVAERQAKNLPLDTTQSKLKRPEIRFNMAKGSRAYKTPPFSRSVDARKEWAPTEISMSGHSPPWLSRTKTLR
jgi:hypothetical protein